MNIIVLSPHPDDEAIGCGGSILQHISSGDNVEVIFLTSGEKGGHGRNEKETKKIREQEAKEAGKILGVQNIEFWEQPDGAVEATVELVEKLVLKIKRSGVDRIYVTHEDETHPDHKAAAKLARLAAKGSTKRLDIWMYEVWTPLQKLDAIIDISEYILVKEKAIQAHVSQCEVLRFDQAILGLNRYRGEMHSWPGGDYAEVFKIMEQ